MLIYSDGVPELKTFPAHSMVLIRLRQLIGQRQRVSPSVLLAACRDDLITFVVMSAKRDDVTLFVRHAWSIKQGG
jgi:serine phosphatase RsbU (regulator of sigma subunit)